MQWTLQRFDRPGAWVIALIWIAGIACLWWTLTPMPSHLASNLLATYLLAWGGVALIARRPAAQLRTRWFLMTGALGFTLVLLEAPALVGIVDYNRVFPVPLIDRPQDGREVPDAELLHIHRPYLREAGTTRGDMVLATNTAVPSAPYYRYDVRYDRNGFRNPTDLTRADIAVIGDSFIEGGLVPSDALLTTVLGRLRGCTVANLGQAKYGPQQELVVLSRYAVPLHPRVCVWAFFEGNDLGEVPRYQRLKTRWPPAPPGRLPFRDRSFTKNALAAFIRVAGLDRSLYDDLLKRSGIVRTPEGPEVRLFFNYPGLPLSDEDRDALDQLAAILGSARDLCERNRIRLVIVFIPTKYRVYQGACQFAPDSPCRGWVRNELPETLRTIVAEVSPEIGFLDLTGPFRERARSGPLLYFPDDTHWSPEGHKLAGRLLSDYLAKDEPGS